MADNTQSAPAKTCFNFCFWAKLIVAIPALPAVAFIASLPFEDSTAKMIAATVALVVVLYLAIKIDRIPALTKKIVNKK